METRRRSGEQGQVKSDEIVRYDELRDDWIKGADLIVRLIAKSSISGVELSGFPRQWIPLFVHFGVNWTSPSAPTDGTPLAADLTAGEIERLSKAAQDRGLLRPMVEAFASLDPLVADVLHKLDRRTVMPVSGVEKVIKLTGWQSYGRPEILALNDLVAKSARAEHTTAVLLPCARRRPYKDSKTHRRIWQLLNAQGIDPRNADQMVVSSIGIVPMRLWNHPVVLAYDSGVPDIYRVLRLMRVFFETAKYKAVIDCLEFRPYSDCLQIVAREGLIGSVEVIHNGRAKSLPRP